MASPSIGSGLTQLDASDANTWQSGQVGNADAAIPVDDLTVSTDGINPPNTCQQFEGSSVGYTSGQKYSAYSDAWTAVDISAANQAILLHFAGNPGQFNQVSTDSDGISIYAFDSGGSRTTNYLTKTLGGSSDGFYKGAATFYPVLFFSASATETGTLDDTDIIEVGVSYKAGSTGQYGVQFRVDQILHVNGEVEFANGDVTTPGTWKRYRDLIFPEAAGTIYNGSNAYLPPAYGFGHGIRMNCERFTDTNFTFIFLPINTDQAFFPPATGYYSLSINPSSVTAIHSYTDGVFAYSSGTYPLTISASSLTSGSITMTRCSFLNAGAVTIAGAKLTMAACTVSSPASISIASADLDISIQNSTAAIQWTADLVAGSTITTNSDIDITFAETDLGDINIVLTASNTITVSPTTGSGTYDLSGLTTTGTVELDNATANNTTITLPAGTSNTVASPTSGGGTITVDSPAVTYTFNSDTASTLIRYFEDDLQTIVDSATGTILAYEFPDADPVDVEFVKQGYVPVNRQDVVPADGGSLDIEMDFDEAYNSSHGLTITSEFDINRGTKLLTLNSDQNALDVRSAFSDVIRTNASYYNTKLWMVAIPGLTRVDLIDGATITSMATWKGAGMEMFDAADSSNPVEKWLATKSVGTITGATTHYRQTSSGDSTALTFTNNVVDEAFQYWSDPNHDGSAADGFDYSDYMVIKSFLAGSKQGRVDVLANAGISALSSNLYTVPLSNEAHDYSGSDPGVSADITLVAGSTVGGVAFAYEIVDGGTNTGENIADQLNYNAAANPNTVIPGGTGLRYFELGNMVIHNATAVETERGYREGSTPAFVGFYVSRSSADHPDFTRFQGDNGTYYTPAVVNQATITNLLADDSDRRLYIRNDTTATVIYNDVPGTTYNDTYTEGGDYTDGDQITIRWAQANGTTDFKSFSTVVTAGSTGWSLDASNFIAANSTYATLGIDGATVTGHTADYTDDEADLTAAANFNGENTQAWLLYILTTSQGITDFWGGYTIGDGFIQIHNATVNMYLDNTTTTNIRETSNIKIFRDDAAYPVKGGGATTGGGGITVRHLDPVYTITTGSGLSAPQAAQLTAIESKTNPLTYTVANKVDANTQYMNDAQVQGDGSSGDKWRGV